MPEQTGELSPRRWLGYAVAVGATALAAAGQLALRQWLGDSLLPLTLAVLASAWLGGGRAGAAATALGAALALAFLLPRPDGVLLDVATEGAPLALFLL